MDERRAKEVLSAYRPELDDARDPDVAAALALTRSDAALGEWYERERRSDAAIRHALSGIAVPVGLKTRILAGQREPRSSWATTFWETWRYRMVGVAASLVAMVASFVALEPAMPGAYREAMLDIVEKPYDLAFETESLDEVKARLAKEGFPADFAVPSALARYPLEGGMLPRWRGQPVAMVCFGDDEEHAPDVWLWVVPRAGLFTIERNTEPRYGAVGELVTASWAQGDRYYFAATEAGEDALRKLLAAG